MKSSQFRFGLPLVLFLTTAQPLLAQPANNPVAQSAEVEGFDTLWFRSRDAIDADLLHGRPADALAKAEALMLLSRREFADAPDMMAIAETSLAEARLAAGQLPLAETSARAALARWDAAMGRESRQAVHTMIVLGQVLAAQLRCSDARTLLDVAYA